MKVEKMSEPTTENEMQSKRRAASSLPSLLLCLLLGLTAACENHRGPEAAPAGNPTVGNGAPSETWTCAMHPAIRRSEAGLCPICNMDLVPVGPPNGSTTAPAGTNDSAHESGALVLEPEQERRAGIRTAPVVRLAVAREVRMVGKVDYDESRVRKISAWVPGRIERVFVDFTGVEVRAGDHLVSLYSPELRVAQEEFLQARRAARSIDRGGVSILRQSASATADAAREKLRLLGLTEEQIASLAEKGEARDHLTIYAPIGGTVVDKQAFEGMYVETGTMIYQIADLSTLWVRLDAYESDIAWIRFGQRVTFTTTAYPGETFEGRVAFVEPTLNDRTRTVKLRVNVANEEGKLKPGMFVSATVRAEVVGGGRVLDPDLAGKWIGPMHPEIVRDEPGACPICGMALVAAEEFAEPAAERGEAPLVIPSSAPLITGDRAVVYVRLPGTDRPTFEGREFVLGPRTDRGYVVRSGLREGEDVVVKGNFKIDSALQIEARPSMMRPAGDPSDPDKSDRTGGPHQHHAH